MCFFSLDYQINFNLITKLIKIEIGQTKRGDREENGVTERERERERGGGGKNARGEITIAIFQIFANEMTIADFFSQNL